jgi:hypothetical protein
LVKQIAAQNQGLKVYFDVWNEPDTSFAWGGTQTQFFQTYVQAYQAIRAELGPSAMIGGPSLSTYNPSFLTAFLNYCAAHNVQVNFLSWHELQNTVAGIEGISTDIANAKNSYQNNQAYSSLAISRIHVNESVGQNIANSPGAIVGVLNQLETGPADASARACWPAANGTSNCYNGTLDGLLTSGTPTGAWWAYQLYAARGAARAASTTTDGRVVAVAGGVQSNGSSAQVLVAYFNPGQSSSATVSPTLNLTSLGSLAFLTGQTTVNVQIQYVPAASGSAALTQPAVVSTATVAINNGSTTIVVPPMGQGDVYQIILFGN